MNFEKIKKNYLKKYLIIGAIIICLFITLIFNYTKAKYRVTQSIPLVNGTINYSLADFESVAIYINSDSGYVEAESIPESGYVLNEDESYCKVNNVRDDSISLLYDVDTKTLNVTPMATKGTKCYLYFDEQLCPAGANACNIILANKALATRTNFTITVTEDTTGTIYYADTSKGRTYYFAGNPIDNWVKFAGFYWRIIRINEDGTIRMVYQGTSANTTGTNTQINTSAFNSSYTDNMYVGYMYTSNQVHGLGTNSTIKGVLDSWYTSNLAGQASKIDGNAGFCGDREPSTSETTSNGSGGTGTTVTYYGTYIRLFTNNVPTFDCTNSSDLYTTSGSTNGNKALTYPIGLITLDEVWYAGGYLLKNSSYYLYTGQHYWTMSPCNVYSRGYADVFIVGSDGYLRNTDVYNTFGVRPVINLKADVTISGGDGTSSNPYTIS